MTNEINVAYPKVSPVLTFHYDGTYDGTQKLNQFMQGGIGTIYANSDGIYSVSAIGDLGNITIVPGDTVVRITSDGNTYHYEVLDKDSFDEFYEL